MAMLVAKAALAMGRAWVTARVLATAMARELAMVPVLRARVAARVLPATAVVARVVPARAMLGRVVVRATPASPVTARKVRAAVVGGARRASHGAMVRAHGPSAVAMVRVGEDTHRLRRRVMALLPLRTVRRLQVVSSTSGVRSGGRGRIGVRRRPVGQPGRMVRRLRVPSQNRRVLRGAVAQRCRVGMRPSVRAVHCRTLWGRQPQRLLTR